MLLECRVDDKTVIYIDAEASAGLDKGEGGSDFVPDKAIDNILRTTAGMAKRLSDLLGRRRSWCRHRRAWRSTSACASTRSRPFR
jgi:hypothetical protein